jgi:predicted DNA-binding transcriptional regulator AlpA
MNFLDPSCLFIPTREPMLTYKDVEKLTRISSRTIARLVHADRFPRPLKIGRNCRWRAEDISRFLETGGVTFAGRVGADQVR